MVFHGYPRTTGDMDIWVKRTEENYQKLRRAFAAFGMPMFDLTEERFLQHEEIDVFRFGRKPVAIDIMTKMGNLHFDECYPLATEYIDDDLAIKVVHYNHLIAAKKAAGRHTDLNDIENLEKEED